MQRNKIFIHVHIPKCGGTTFQNILKQNVSKPRAFYREAPLVMHKHNSIDIKLMIERASHIEVFSSHHVSLDLPFNLEKPKVIAISHVRDPIDRFISHFFYEKRRSNKKGVIHFDSNINNMTLDQYVDFCLENREEYMHIKDQVTWLTGKTDNKGIEEVDKLVKQGQLYLFPLDRFDESCVLLEKLYTSNFNNCAFVKLNVSQQKNEISENTKLKIDKLINPTDYKLVEIANNQLNRLCREFFTSNEYFRDSMNNFYDRCSKFEKDKMKLQKKQQILKRFNKLAKKILSMK